jgi:hypothetical protein
MMSKCVVCYAPTDMTLCDTVSEAVRMQYPMMPLVGCCGKQECADRAIELLDLRKPGNRGPKVKVIGGMHEGMIGTLYSNNWKTGIAFIRPEPADGTLKPVFFRNLEAR